MMNPIEQLSQFIRASFPEAELRLDPAQKQNGTWFLDVELNGYPLSVEWQRHRGFGLTSSTDTGYGEGADETYRDLDAARERAIELLSGQLSTQAPTSVTLDELRQSRRTG